MNEQTYINSFFSYMQSPLLNKIELERLIKDIEKKFPQSPILQYYIGFYFDDIGQKELAKTKFTKCIKLLPYFSQPYLHLANIFLGENNFNDAQTTLFHIFGKKTIDPKSGSLSRSFNPTEQMQIGVMLQTSLEKVNKNKESKKVLLKMKRLLDSPESKLQKTDPFYVLWSKQIHLALSNNTRTSDPEESIEYLLNGCKESALSQIPQITAVQKQLLSKLLIDMHYSTTDLQSVFQTTKRLVTDVYSDMLVPKFHYKNPSKGKIHIGYLSPDFNKNAVGLFLTPFLKHFDKKTFKVHVFYTNPCTDEFTTVFQNYPEVTWINAANMDDATLFNSIKFTHNIDILVDLISAGIGNRMELIAMGPADVVINYLGYPGTSFLPTATHKLVDNFSDPPGYDHENTYTEKLIRMRRCFLCFTLFENIDINRVPIKESFPKESPKIFAGVMNKSLKFHPQILQAWRKILQENENLVLCIKNDKEDSPDHLLELLNDNQIHHSRVQIIPFQKTLENYLEQFNHFHFCLDTFPYSGTTTTCTSLFMGVPVFSIYDPHNSHVSNVSASIIKNTDENLAQTFLCQDIDHYISSVTTFCQTSVLPTCDIQFRKSLRSQFLQAMDPIRFMAEYENVMRNVIHDLDKTPSTSSNVIHSPILSLGEPEHKYV